MSRSIVFGLGVTAGMLLAGVLYVVGITPAEPTEAPRSSPPVEVTQAAPEPTEDCGHARLDAAVREAVLDPPKGWTIQAECGGAEKAGLADYHRRTITVWPSLLDDAELTRTLLHEYGHIRDQQYLGNEDRALWMYARSLSGRWQVGHEGPNEDFAESFAYCLAGGDSWLFEELGAEPPGRAECALILALLSEADMPGLRALADAVHAEP